MKALLYEQFFGRFLDSSLVLLDDAGTEFGNPVKAGKKNSCWLWRNRKS
jgi:hypothetical protein